MSEGFKERLNRYTCKTCGESVITRDDDVGVTPMIILCRATPGCTGNSTSSFYRDVTGEPAFIWRKPTKREYAAMSPEMRQHIDMGGLNIYPVKP